jgi:two-component system sensor histidine kinase PilS (NtrC family)
VSTVTCQTDAGPFRPHNLTPDTRHLKQVTDSPLASTDRRTWLLRLICVRLIVFSVFVTAQYFFVTIEPSLTKPTILVYALTGAWLLLWRFNSRYSAQASAQIAVDLLLITWTVNLTGGIDSYFSSLYFLVIVMSSILLDRRGAFLTAIFCSVIHLANLDLAYLGYMSWTAQARPELSWLQYIICLNVFAFCAVAFLSNHLAERWRSAGAELKKSTGQVAFLQAFSGRIIESMGSGLITTDLQGRIFIFNEAAEKITGCSARDALQMTIEEVLPGIMSKADLQKCDIWTRRLDGNDAYLRFTVSSVSIDDKSTKGYVWCFEDLTELRMLERQVRQKEQMAAIGAMSAGIAHEIRNPLASITGSFNLLQSDLVLNGEQRELVSIIMRETERLNRTIKDFLSYARLPAPKPERTDLSVLISETVSLMRNSPELKPTHKIETELEPVYAMVDEGMMRQVFYNLATNAFKAMPDGGVLTIALEARNGVAKMRFRDTGIGFTEEDLKKLFLPFHSSFKNGTGLGLPIVYRIITAHNGAIGVKSRQGAGTTFFIDI